ncbi:cupin domain-containing protein [Ensifer sp. HO-A22]|uniref:Cupin domain-containing protein n=2 Tax=Ensifer oleiphilus TaxID=2742698 RepID=A0A7Y6QC43_9HYPH|nr:cupin domain-containing protein [Ensifer oleiphilus]
MAGYQVSEAHDASSSSAAGNVALASVKAVGESVETAFEEAIPNVPGKRLVALEVLYAPGGKSPSHRHAPSSFIYAYVLSGAIRSQVDDQSPRVYRVGESFYENTGSHHRISENASTTEPAKLLAVFIVDTHENPLTTPD